MGAIDEQNKRIDRLERKCQAYDDFFGELASRIVEYTLPDSKQKGKAFGFVTRFDKTTERADIVAFSNHYSGGVLELVGVPRYKPDPKIENPEEQIREKTFEYLFDMSEITGVYTRIPAKEEKLEEQSVIKAGAKDASPAAS